MTYYKSLFFSPEGRIGRAKFWIGLLILLGISIAVAVLFSILGAIVGGNEATAPGEFKVNGVKAIPYVILAFAFTIFTMWAGICMSIKRCHDRDRSGWFILVSAIPFVNFWYIVEVAFLPGTSGINRFGANPVGQVATT
jgi:uncharacterized membrane protein YhaH (DUF805 family)